MKNEKITLFLVDDDALFLKSMEIDLLHFANIKVKTFATGELCIENLSLHPDIIVLDYQLNSIEKKAMNGIDTLDKIKLSDPAIIVIMLSSQDKIEVAVNCMHHGAIDYVVKSETAFLRLQKIITGFLEAKRTEKKLNWYMDRM